MARSKTITEQQRENVRLELEKLSEPWQRELLKQLLVAGSLDEANAAQFLRSVGFDPPNQCLNDLAVRGSLVTKNMTGYYSVNSGFSNALSEALQLKEPSQIWTKTCSWPVVGTVVTGILGLAISFMLAARPLLAEVCYVLGLVLLYVKFVTWEDARGQNKGKRRVLFIGAFAITAFLIVFAIWGTQQLNPKPVEKAPPPTAPVAAAPVQEVQPQQTPPPGGTEERHNTNDSVTAIPTRHEPKDTATATVQHPNTNPRPATPAKAAPSSSPNISTGDINAGPCSNIQIGGSNNQASSNCVLAAPQRVLNSDQIAALKRNVAPYPAKIFILYQQGDDEAYKLAQQIGDTLLAAGWTLKQPVTGAMFFSEGGGPLHGIKLSWRGEAAVPGQLVTFNLRSSAGILAGTLQFLFKPGFSVSPSPDADADLIHLEVYPNLPPKSPSSP